MPLGDGGSDSIANGASASFALSLAASRARGEAWNEALGAAFAAARGAPGWYGHGGWYGALIATLDGWRRSYHGDPPTLGDLACAALYGLDRDEHSDAVPVAVISPISSRAPRRMAPEDARRAFLGAGQWL